MAGSVTMISIRSNCSSSYKEMCDQESVLSTHDNKDSTILFLNQANISENQTNNFSLNQLDLNINGLGSNCDISNLGSTSIVPDGFIVNAFDGDHHGISNFNNQHYQSNTLIEKNYDYQKSASLFCHPLKTLKPQFVRHGNHFPQQQFQQQHPQQALSINTFDLDESPLFEHNQMINHKMSISINDTFCVHAYETGCEEEMLNKDQLHEHVLNNNMPDHVQEHTLKLIKSSILHNTNKPVTTISGDHLFVDVDQCQHEVEHEQKLEINDEIKKNHTSSTSDDDESWKLDSKNKHRISDARWRESVSRCYSLLKICTHAQQNTTRMSILKVTLAEIQRLEQRIEQHMSQFRNTTTQTEFNNNNEFTVLCDYNEIKSFFGKFESMANFSSSSSANVSKIPNKQQTKNKEIINIDRDNDKPNCDNNTRSNKELLSIETDNTNEDTNSTIVMTDEFDDHNSGDN